MALCFRFVLFVCLEAEIWYVDCCHKYKIRQGVMVGGIQPLVEDDLWLKTTICGRQPSV